MTCIEPPQKVIIFIKNKTKEINTDQILYIEISKYLKKIHLINVNNEATIEEIVLWETRDSAQKIISQLGEKAFIRVHKHFITKRTNIYGRDKDWKYLQIRKFISPRKKASQPSWLTKEIKMGQKYIEDIKKYLNKCYISIKLKDDEDRDVLYINPIDIIYIEIYRDEKKIYLDVPYSKRNRNTFSITWKTRESAINILNRLNTDFFLQVQRNHIINLRYTYRKNEDKNHLYLKVHPKNVKNNKTREKRIPVKNTFITDISDFPLENNSY